MSRKANIAIWTSISLTFLFCYGLHIRFPLVQFDSDQAMIGIMGTDLLHGRLLPWTFYGQKYMLAVEAWAAALSFAVLGVSFASLKFPLLLVNVATIALLIHALRRSSQLSLWAATLSTLPLITPPVVLGSYLMASLGANPWVLMYVALIWVLRDRPKSLGVILGAAYFQREFVLLGFLSLLCTDVLETVSLRIRGRLKQRLTTLFVAFATYHSLVGLGQFNPEFIGMGTPRPHLVTPMQLIQNIKYLATTQLPPLLGLGTLTPSAYGLLTNVAASLTFWVVLNTILLGTIKLLALLSLIRDRRKILGTKEYSLPFYLVLTAVGQVILYAVFINDNATVLVRYLLLAPLAVVGILALALIQAQKHAARRTAALVAASALSLALSNLTPAIQLAHEQITAPPPNPTLNLAVYLRDHGYRYGWASYWDAYYISFATNEAVIISATDNSRVTRYRKLLKEHESEAFVLGAPGSCADTTAPVIEGRQVCPLARYTERIHEKEYP